MTGNVKDGVLGVPVNAKEQTSEVSDIVIGGDLTDDNRGDLADDNREDPADDNVGDIT